MAVGAFTLFNKAKKKLGDGTIDLDTHGFIAVLCGSAQSLSAAFPGASADCRYADLTAELATANGYTQLTKALASDTWVESAGVVTFDAADLVWTATGAGFAYKYLVVVDNTAANKDLLGFVDADTSSGAATVSVPAGPHTAQWNVAGLFEAA